VTKKVWLDLEAVGDMADAYDKAQEALRPRGQIERYLSHPGVGRSVRDVP
jgi:hypothetical protein